jgi:hypothetical protein
MVELAKERRKHAYDTYKSLEIEHAKLQKSHEDDLKIIEELRGTIKRDANQISDLKLKNAEATMQNADLAKANSEKDLRIISLEKDLADHLKVRGTRKRKLKITLNLCLRNIVKVLVSMELGQIIFLMLRIQ